MKDIENKAMGYTINNFNGSPDYADGLEAGFTAGYNEAISEVVKDIEEIIKEIANQHPYKQVGNPDSYSTYNEAWTDACDVILSELLTKYKQ